MSKISKTLRALAVFLCAALIVMTLSSCFKENIAFQSNDSDDADETSSTSQSEQEAHH
jgi:hypothetical protein